MQVPTWYGWARRRACTKAIDLLPMLTRVDNLLMLLDPFNATVYVKVGMQADKSLTRKVFLGLASPVWTSTWHHSMRGIISNPGMHPCYAM